MFAIIILCLVWWVIGFVSYPYLRTAWRELILEVERCEQIKKTTDTTP